MIMSVEMSGVFRWVFNDFLGKGLSFIDSIDFAINGHRYSVLDMMIGALVFGFAVMLIKTIFNINFRKAEHDYIVGRSYIKDKPIRENNIKVESKNRVEKSRGAKWL